MTHEEALHLIINNPVFWSRLGFCYDPPLKNEAGKPFAFTEDFSRHAALHRSFADIGVKIHTCIVHLGWMGIDEYDYSLTDRVLDEIFRTNPDCYFIPRIKLNVPIDWCRENPEEVFVYPEGPRTAEEIRALVGTAKQDYMGYDAPNGYYMAGDFADTRPNVGGLIARQSFSSKKWLKDASVALEKLLDRVENSRYGEKILGYHIAYGTSGECVLWGRISERYGDYGIGHRRAFFRWGLEKYGSREALSEAWCQPNVTEDTLILPTPAERYDNTATVAGIFRASRESVIATDFDIFSSEVNTNAIEHFAKIIRQKAPNKLTGAFYGYFLGVDNAVYAGHLGIEKLLDSPYVDFFAAPKSYYRCRAGQPGGMLSTPQSVNLKKIWLDELDNRTHISKNVPEKWISENFKTTQTVFWREFAKNLSDGSGFWWMDLGDGWFNDAQIMGEFEKLVNVQKDLNQTARKSTADILVLVDEKCLAHMNISHDLRMAFTEDFICELKLTGCSMDVYRLADLETLDLTQYRLIVFANTFSVSAQQCVFIQNIAPDKTLMFNYACGVISDNSVSLENCRKLTGIALEEAPGGEYHFPQLRAAENTAVRANGGINIVNTTPFLQAADLRSIAEKAGCHVYAPCGCTVFADNRFVAVFPSEDVDAQITMRNKATYQNLITGEKFADTDRISYKATAKSATFWQVIECRGCN